MKRSVAVTLAVVAAVVVVAIFALLYTYFDPTHSYLAPKCIFHTLTGYECPACGVQRAAHAVLNGEFYKALMLNPFLALAVPYLIAVALTTFIKTQAMLRVRAIVQHRYAMIGYVVIFFVWWVVRNTPWWQKICENIC